MDEHGHRLRGRGTIVLIGFLLVAGFFLLTEHRAHFFGALPYLLLLACPLMHLFMHHGHGDSRHGHPHGGTSAVPVNSNPRADGEPR